MNPFLFFKGIKLFAAHEIYFLHEKLAIVSQGQNANYDGVLDCVQCTTEGMTEARNYFLQLYKEAEEFAVSYKEIHPIERPREQKEEHRDFRPCEHNLERTPF